ncbi:MAG: UDP-N-acetylglucosamine 1-carboxyvinyltransferase [Firmicutes bacterium]|nr:UDP-N-acetylglucosamine 1-carboxyvinyltransferase [Bacillota bacterium]
MAIFSVIGGRQLHGKVRLDGSKNSALAILAGSALGCGKSILHNVPDNTDVRIFCEILSELGVSIRFIRPGVYEIDGSYMACCRPSYEKVRRLRASFYTAGLLLARLGTAEVPFPGGDAIGARGVNFHLDGFRALGADVAIEHGYIKLKANPLKGTSFYIGKASHGTTVNIMLAACLAEGTTILENSARDPEIVDLAVFLNSMGARIRGAGTSTIKIEGVTQLHGAIHEVIPDRLEAGTLAIAAAITGGEITISNAIPEHLRTVLMDLRATGTEINEYGSVLHVCGPDRCKASDIETLAYPGFPTDLQPQYVAMMTKADGISTIVETRFESRFGYVGELRRMGAELQADRDTVIVRGVNRLTGAPVEAPRDIRGGVALLLAGLIAEGETRIHCIEYIDRGYNRIEEKLASLGGIVKRIG